MTGLQVQHFGSAFTVSMPQERQYPVNGANAVGLFEPATERLLDDLLHYFRARGCGFGVSVSPVAQPRTLVAWLLERGFTAVGRTPVVYRSTTQLPAVATDIIVKRIGPPQAALWKQVFQQVFVPYLAIWQAALIGHEGRYHYLAFDQDTPVAASQMSVNAGIGMLHFTGVLAPYRGRGVQRAMIQRWSGRGLYWRCV